MARSGTLEAAVMRYLWQAEAPCTVRDVLSGLEHPTDPGRALAYTTVMTVMDRLHRKGLLTREPHGRAFLYRATESQGDHTATLMAEVLGETSDRSAALVHFARQLGEQERLALTEALTAGIAKPTPP